MLVLKRAVDTDVVIILPTDQNKLLSLAGHKIRVRLCEITGGYSAALGITCDRSIDILRDSLEERWRGRGLSDPGEDKR